MRSLFFMLLAVAPFVPGCQCSGNGHVEPPTRFFARPNDDVVHCVCNLTFDNEHCTGGHCAAHFNLDLCLPLPLQDPDGGVAAPDASDVDGGSDADSGPDAHARAVDRYCRDQASHVVYHMIKVFNGGWCDYKAPYAPDGGIGDSVSCFAQPVDDTLSATTSDDGTCRTTCAPVDCDYMTNCGSDVQDAEGNIHPDRCRCSVISKYGCPGDPASDLPTPLFCRPPS